MCQAVQDLDFPCTYMEMQGAPRTEPYRQNIPYERKWEATVILTEVMTELRRVQW